MKSLEFNEQVAIALNDHVEVDMAHNSVRVKKRNGKFQIRPVQPNERRLLMAMSMSEPINKIGDPSGYRRLGNLMGEIRGKVDGRSGKPASPIHVATIVSALRSAGILPKKK